LTQSKDIYRHEGKITREGREKRNRHKGVTIWLTGLSASGKSSIACLLEERLFERGCHAVVLDGDNVRHGLNKDLGFSKEDRDENIRRISELAVLLTTKGIITIAAFISPYKEDRRRARALHSGDFIEVFLNCPLGVCEQRDPKGLYKKARAGELKCFTGIDDPYEEPEASELVLDTCKDDLERCVDDIIEYLAKTGILM